MSARVVCRVRTGVTLSFEIGEKAAYLGRDEAAAVSVPVDGVSRHHARIAWDGKSHWLEDLKSTNGTFLNGKAVSRERLQHLDVITLGKDADLVFLQRTASAAPAKVKGITRAALAPEGSEAVQDIKLGEITLGRAQSCNVVAEAAGVSKVHARIERTRDQLVLEDLGSANGTFVNGTRVTSAFLNHDDVVSLGGAAAFRVVIEMGEIASPTASGRFATSTGSSNAPGKPRFSADWKTRYEWSDSEQNLLADMRQRLAEEDVRRQAGRVRRDVTVEPTAKAAAAFKAAVPKAAVPAAAPAKPAPPAPAASSPAPAAPPRVAATPAPAPKTPPPAPATPAPAAASPPPAPAPAPAAAKAPTATPAAPAPASAATSPPAVAKTPAPAVGAPRAAATPPPVVKPTAAQPTTAPPKPPAPAPPSPPPAVAQPAAPPPKPVPPPIVVPPAPAPTKPAAAPALSGSPTVPAPPPVAPPPPAAVAVAEAKPAPTGRIIEVQLSGPDAQLVVTEPGAHDLGRSSEMELRVNNPTVSRRHARIILSDDRGMAYVQDQGGSNGTRLNGKEVGRLAPLNDGDTIGIGNVELRVTLKRG